MRRRLLPALALAVPLAGCPGSLDDPSRFAGQFGLCPDVPTFLATTCGTASCHAATMPQAGLDLASPDVFSRLAGTKAMGGPGLLIDPTDPSASVLYLKLEAPPPFGSRMPLTGMPLDDTGVACVLDWIETSTKGGSP